MSLKTITQQLFSDTFGYAATHTIQAPGRVQAAVRRPSIRCQESAGNMVATCTREAA